MLDHLQGCACESILEEVLKHLRGGRPSRKVQHFLGEDDPEACELWVCLTHNVCHVSHNVCHVSHNVCHVSHLGQLKFYFYKF